MERVLTSASKKLLKAEGMKCNSIRRIGEFAKMFGFSQSADGGRHGVKLIKDGVRIPLPSNSRGELKAGTLNSIVKCILDCADDETVKKVAFERFGTQKVYSEALMSVGDAERASALVHAAAAEVERAGALKGPLARAFKSVRGLPLTRDVAETVELVLMCYS